MKRLLWIMVVCIFIAGCGGNAASAPAIQPTAPEHAATAPDGAADADAAQAPTAAVPAAQDASTVAPPAATPADASATPSPLALVDSGQWLINAGHAGDVALLYELRGDIPGRLQAQAWSPDGKWLAVGGTGGTLLLDGASLALVEELRTAAPVTGLAFSADGRRLAVSSDRRLVQVWDFAARKVIRAFSQMGYQAVLSPDGKLIAALEDGEDMDNSGQMVSRITIQVFQVDTGNLLSTLTGILPLSIWNTNTLSTEGIYFSPDGKTLQAANNFGDVRIWDVNSGRLLNTSLNDHTRGRLSSGVCEGAGLSGATFALACQISYLDPPCIESDPNCNPVSKSRFDVGIWETNQLRRTSNLIFKDPPGGNYRLIYDPFKRSSALFDPDELLLYRPTAGGTATVQALKPTMAAQWQEMKSACPNCGWLLALSPSGKMLAAARGGRMALVDLEQGEITQSRQLGISALSGAALGVQSGRPALAAGYTDGSIAILQAADGAQQRKIEQAHKERVIALAFTADGLLSLGRDGSLNLWGAQGASPLRSFKTSYLSSQAFIGYRFAYNPQTDLLLLDGDGSALKAIALKTGQDLFSIPDKPALVALSRDGNWLATGDSWKAALYDARTGAQLRSFEPAKSGPPLSGLALSPDGSLMAVALDGSALVMDVNSRAEVARFQEAGFAAYQVEFDPSGCLLAVGGLDGRILLSDLQSGQVLARLDGHAAEIQSLSFSADGRLLFSFGGDRAARVWGLADALAQPAGQALAQTCRLASAPATSTPTTAAPTPTPTLTATPAFYVRDLFLSDPAMTGGDVLQLQQRLVELGYSVVGTPDGWFGAKTDEAVRQFQQRNGLVVDGIVGRITWARLFSPDAVGK